MTKSTIYSDAEEQFAIAMKEAPGKGEGYLGAGRMEIRHKDYVAALPLLEKAAKLMPKDEDAQFFLGLAQPQSLAIQRMRSTRLHCVTVAIYPSNANSLSGLGMAAMENKQFDKAVKAFDDAYQASRQANFLFQKGQAAFFGKKYQLAQTGFANFVAIYPNDAQGQFWYGLAAWRLEQKDFAIKKLEEAAKLQPNDQMIAEGLKMAQAGETLRFERETPDEPAVAATDKKNDPDKKDDTNPFAKTDKKDAAVAGA